MAGNSGDGDGQRVSRWRIAFWSGAVLLLLAPWIAMRFTDEVAWDAFDFAVFGALLLGVGITYEVTARQTVNTAFRMAVGIALASAFVLVWLSLGVGIIGRDGDPANLMYSGVLAVGIVGALIARFRPGGMARSMLTVALAQALVAAIALIGGLGRPWSGPLELSLLNGFFVALWIGSAWFFRKAARE